MPNNLAASPSCGKRIFALTESLGFICSIYAASRIVVKDLSLIRLYVSRVHLLLIVPGPANIGILSENISKLLHPHR